MRLKCSTAFLLLTTPWTVPAAQSSTTLELMPVPASIELGDGHLEIDADFSVSIAGEGAGRRLERGVWRMLRRLSDRTTFFFDNDVFLELEGRDPAILEIVADRVGELVLGEDESYRL